MAAQRKKLKGMAKKSAAPARAVILRTALAVVGAGLLFGGGIGVGAWIAGDRPSDATAQSVAPMADAPAPLRTPDVPAAGSAAAGPVTAPGIPLPKMTDAVEAAARAKAPTPTAGAPAATVAAVPPPPSTDASLPTWRRFAVAGDTTSDAPKIAIVLDDLGIDTRRSHRAVALPAPLTLAYLPYADGLEDQTRAARRAGHELLVHIPMQPHGADADPGPNALDMRLGAIEVLSRLEWDLDRFEGYVGINNHMGSLFTESEEGMRLVAEGLRDRGLIFLDSLTSPRSVAAVTAASMGVPTTVRDVFLDNTDTAAEVELRLAQTERIARQTGTAIAIGHPRDATLNVLEAWIPKAREAGFVLVPLTSVLQIRQGLATQQAGRP